MLRRCTLGLILSLAVMPLSAQMHHVDEPRQVTRAVGVYEWTGDLTKPDAERLIPVSLFINGQYQDAGVFLAQPVPFALETGNVYALQKSGAPIGTFDLDYARNIVDRHDVADDNPIGAWYGYGRFLPLSITPPPPLHPSSHLSVIASTGDDDQPHFINRSPGEGGNPTPSATSTTSSTNTPAPPDDPDRPVLHRAPNSGSSDTSTSTTSPDNAPSSPGTADTENDPERPTLGHRDDTDTDNKKQEKEEEKRRKRAADGGAVIPLSTSLNDDPNRPTLHHGKDESAVAPPPLTGFPPNLHQAVAVSDAATPPQHIFARDWDSPAERADTLAAMQKLAQPLAQQYLATNHLQPASAGPKLVTSSTRRTSSSTHRTTHRAAPPKTTPLVFQEEQLAGFTLSYGGLPTFVYTVAIPTLPASAPVSPATTPTHATTHHLSTVPAGVMATDAAATQPLPAPLVRVTIVAQRLPAGNLQVSLSSATDDAHLDRAPWMRLIDAVDADGSHRASLLFELRAKSSRQFALYSLASAHAQQTFITGILE